MPAQFTGRILVCTGHFWPHVGGVERHAAELWSRIVQRGWQVQLLTANTDASAERESVGGIDVIRLPVLNLMDRRMPVLLPSGALLALFRELSEAPPDVIVTNTRFFPSTVLGQLMARAWRRPTLHIEHGSGRAVTGSAWSDSVANAIDVTIGAAVLKSATRCVGVSQAVADFVARLGRDDAGVLYNGVDCDSFSVDGSIQRRELGIPADEPYILFLGRLYEDKGALQLLRAFEELSDRLRAHLVFAGDGPLTPRIREAARRVRGIEVLGFVDAGRVPALLASCDILAHPSMCSEGMPTAVLEAAAAGRAVVASRVGGTSEVIVDGRTGLLVEPGDEAALRSSLARLCESPDLRARLGAAAAARCREVFDWRCIAGLAERELRALLTTDPQD